MGRGLLCPAEHRVLEFIHVAADINPALFRG